MQRRTFLEAGLATVGGSVVLGSTSGQETASFEPVGSVEIPGATEAVPHEDENIVYVAAGDGLAAVDVTGGTPEIVSEDRGVETDDGRQFRALWDLWPSGDRLILAGPANEGMAAATGFALYDISEPATPEILTVYETDFAIHNASFEDSIVYLTGTSLASQPLVMVDVSDDDPAEVGRFSIVDQGPEWANVSRFLRDLHDVHVQDGVAYLAQWDAGAWLVDVSDPADPAVLSRVGPYSGSELQEFTQNEVLLERFIPPGNAHVTTVNEDATVLAVGAESWAFESNGTREGGAGGVDLYDISDKTEPQHLSTIDPPDSYGQMRSEWFTTAHNFDIADSRLYTSWYYGGVKIHDIDDPANPEEIAWWRDPEEASFWTAQSAGDVLVASSANIQSKLGDGPNATRDALYVFPNAAGTQPDPPSLTEPPGADGQNDNGGANGNNGGTDDGTTNQSQDGGADGTESDADDSGAGFGVGAAVLGAAGAGYALSRRGERE